MALTLNGSNNTIAGLAVGGLPDGIVDTDMIAANAVTAPKRGAGATLQVASTTKTDIFSSTTAQAWTDITGVSIAITPISTSSKILINTSITYGLDHGYSMIIFRLMRGSTEIGIADAANNRPRGTFSGDPKDDAYLANACFTHLDSPSSTSEQTYKVQFYDYHGNTFYVNRTSRHWDASTYDFVGASNITVTEVAA